MKRFGRLSGEPVRSILFYPYNTEIYGAVMMYPGLSLMAERLKWDGMTEERKGIYLQYLRALTHKATLLKYLQWLVIIRRLLKEKHQIYILQKSRMCVSAFAGVCVCQRQTGSLY